MEGERLANDLLGEVPAAQLREEGHRIDAFVATLDSKDIAALKIAVSNLGSSFDITKSIAYVKWLKLAC